MPGAANRRHRRAGRAVAQPSFISAAVAHSDLAADFWLQEDSSYNRIKTLVNEELKQYFRPEFLNRLVRFSLYI